MKARARSNDIPTLLVISLISLTSGIVFGQEADPRELYSGMQLGPWACAYSVSDRTITLDSPCVTSADVKYSSLSEIYILMSRREGFLMDQYDKYLQRQGYAIPSGGLCGPTAVNAILQAGQILAKDPYQRDDVQVGAIVRTYTRITGRDGRLGMNPDALLLSAQTVNPRFNHQKLTRLDPRSLEEIFSDRWSMALIGVKFEEASSGVHDAHAIVLVGIDTAQQRVIVSDPNHPQNVHFQPYEETTLPNGSRSIRFQVFPIYGKHSHWVTLTSAYKVTYRSNVR